MDERIVIASVLPPAVWRSAVGAHADVDGFEPAPLIVGHLGQVDGFVLRRAGKPNVFAQYPAKSMAQLQRAARWTKSRKPEVSTC
jgi:phosphohistidine phosphatase SixA